MPATLGQRPQRVVVTGGSTLPQLAEQVKRGRAAGQQAPGMVAAPGGSLPQLVEHVMISQPPEQLTRRWCRRSG